MFTIAIHTNIQTKLRQSTTLFNVVYFTQFVPNQVLEYSGYVVRIVFVNEMLQRVTVMYVSNMPNQRRLVNKEIHLGL